MNRINQPNFTKDDNRVLTPNTLLWVGSSINLIAKGKQKSLVPAITITVIGFLVSLCLSTVSHATSFTTKAAHEPTIFLTQGTDEYKIGEQVLLVRDPNLELDAAAVMDMEPEAFILSTQPVINIGVTSDPVWGKFTVDTTKASHWAAANKWVMFIRFPLISHIEFYALDPTTGLPQLIAESGSTLPIGTSGVAHPFHIFPLELPQSSDQHTFIFRVQSDFSIQMPIYINNHRALLQTDIGLFIFWGLVFGVVLALTAHLILVIAVIGYKSIIYYLLFVISGSFLLACGNSITFYFLWPDNPEWNISIIPAAASIVSLACLMFVKELLDLPQVSETLNTISNVFIVGVVLSVVLPAFSNQDYTIVTVTSSVFIAFYILYLTFYCTLKKVLIAKYLFFGWIAYLTGASLHVAVMHNLLPYNTFTIHAKEVAVVIEMFLVSLGLAQRTKAAHKEKLEALYRHREKSEALKHLGVAIEKPLSAIAQRIQYAQQTNRHSPQHKGDLLEIRDGSETLLCLVNDMLDIERMDAGKLELEQIPFQLSEVVNAALATVRFTAQEGNVEVIKPTAHCLSNYYSGDPNRLRQVLTNLLGEVITQENVSKIRFNVEFLTLKSNQSELFFVVENIPDDGLETSEETKETSLSIQRPIELKLSKALLKIMGTHLRTEVNNGTLISASFSLRLNNLDQKDIPKNVKTLNNPTASLQPFSPYSQNDTNHSEDRLAAISQLKILVVDDDTTNLKVMAEHLKDMGVSFDLAQGGHKALEKIGSNHFDLVFMDLRMPNIDGFDTTTAIRHRFDASQLPVIALTADAYPEIQEKCFEVGMNGFLTRPLHAGEFENLLYSYASKEVTNKAPVKKPAPVLSNKLEVGTKHSKNTGNNSSSFKLDLLYPLKELQWSPEMVRSQLQGFINEYAQYPESINNAFKEDNPEQIRQIVHTIRGAAIAINASRLVYFIDRTKASIDNDVVSTDEIGALVNALTEVIDACRVSLHELEAQTLGMSE